MKKFLIALFLSLLLALPVSAPAATPKNPTGFEGKAYDATMALYATMGTDTSFICTIWNYKQVSGGYDLISAGHCVGDINADSYSVSDTIDGPRTPVKLVKWVDNADEGLDFSLWELLTTKKYPVLDLGSATDVHIGDEVINPNCALGLTKFLSLGRISGPLVPDVNAVPVYPVEVDGAGGSSGSAVISAKTHKVIGILIYGPPSETEIQARLGVSAHIGVGVEPIDNFEKFLQITKLLPKVEAHRLKYGIKNSSGS
jgi:trypsin-like peptidase